MVELHLRKEIEQRLELLLRLAGVADDEGGAQRDIGMRSRVWRLCGGSARRRRGGPSCAEDGGMRVLARGNPCYGTSWSCVANVSISSGLMCVDRGSASAATAQVRRLLADPGEHTAPASCAAGGPAVRAGILRDETASFVPPATSACTSRDGNRRLKRFAL